MNALDAVEEAGGGRVAVRLLGSPAEIRISDEGAGISTQAAARLFQPRFTTKPEGKGSGLGLHIARQAMQRSGGDVRLVDAADPRRLPWARTEFSISLAPALERTG
jgi:signal transduction histidine kinase